MSKLLCTFTDKRGVFNIVNEINEYNVILEPIEVFSEVKSGEYILLYEIEQLNQVPKRTLPVHKKSNTNTIYTINALNELIRNMNNGVISRNVTVPWHNYSNSLLLTERGKLIKKEINFRQILK